MGTWLGCSPVWALALPVSAALYTAMTVSSAVRHHRGHGAAWKGRAYGAGMAPGQVPMRSADHAAPPPA
jgi:pyruvate-formate lyase